MTPSNCIRKPLVGATMLRSRSIVTDLPTEIRSDPAYLTNCAASYMAIKKFWPALEDCQPAVTLQSASPSPKTLIRLARCQLLVIGSPNSALSALRSALSIEPTNEAALHLQTEALELERHLQK